MEKGVYETTQKNGKIVFRASITYLQKHISLGTFNNHLDASDCYEEAKTILYNNELKITDYKINSKLSHEKWVVLINYRDNKRYCKNPIYTHKYYFSYYLDQQSELTFDTDDFFFFSQHKIHARQGYYYVNLYGSQINILSRFSIKNHARKGIDYVFLDGNQCNFRRHNLKIINPYYGVERILYNSITRYKSSINLKGKCLIDIYNTQVQAAVAYNKVADFLEKYNIQNKKYPRNYITNLPDKKYWALYANLKIPNKFITLLNEGNFNLKLT